MNIKNAFYFERVHLCQMGFGKVTGFRFYILYVFFLIPEMTLLNFVSTLLTVATL